MNSPATTIFGVFAVTFMVDATRWDGTRWVANAASSTTTSDQIVERMSRLDVLFEPTGRDS